MNTHQKAGHRIIALANLAVIPALFAYFEWSGLHEATKVALTVVAFIIIPYGVVRVGLEAHEADKHYNDGDETGDHHIGK